MPANNVYGMDEERTYTHVYNKGIAEKTIFNDKEDYEVFLGYLKQYLSPPDNSDNTKKTFTIRGRAFRGTPHQPKNYFNQVKLIAYSLTPTYFHLLLHQLTDKSLEYFMRSLCTRYSIYFNKKYQRTGSLFEGPYKSVVVGDVSYLLHLTRCFHLHSKNNPTENHSSYPEYLGERDTPWIKPKVALSLFDRLGNSSSKGIKGYKNFVEKYEFNQEEQDLFGGINIEEEKPESITKPTTKSAVDSKLSTWSRRLPEFSVITVVFVLLFTLGIRNIQAANAKLESKAPPPTSSIIDPAPPVPESTPSVSGVQDTKPKIILVVTINDASESVNIRQGPTINSEKIGKAKDGETFEFVSLDSGWYEIKLDDESTGYMSASYLEIDGGTD